MSFHVSFQRGILGETLQADVAFERFFSGMHPDMFREIPLSGELLFARIARVRFYFVVIPFVEVKRVARFAFLAADFARERRFLFGDRILQNDQEINIIIAET